MDLRKPKKTSRKGENGVLLVVGGSKRFHGAPLLAIQAASRFVDLVFFHSPEKSNHALLEKMKAGSCLFITVPRKELSATVEKCDCVLAGNGLEPDAANKKCVNRMLRKNENKKFVLDAGALRVVDKKLLTKNVLVTPHANEFKALFGLPATKKNVKEAAKRFGCIVLLKGPVDVVSDGKTVFENKTGNAGMTKGGTGDVLAGLAAALACKNSLFSAAKAAAKINGLAGDLLYKELGPAFNAQDLVLALPIAFNIKRPFFSYGNQREG